MRWIINDLLTKPPKIIVLEDLHVKEMLVKKIENIKTIKKN